ncbi:Putative beta-glucan synthesis-associated protein Skn1/Kre6/Sbg1 [Septoria linicola]|uniref:Beta-glucan synthesis-associated protein Skn1/Kre6/Sbg1 n=1 Tax=Septoria linicola TaxID=215465 RepID=A0A9Q9EHN0_9PEZI|nr:Putative beta-glucan synthesis-associated protein Skn1/Kre6/Sbg1 [Septoria linicola]
MAPSQAHKLTKHHLQPALRGPSRSFDGRNDHQIQQAGRSATNLNAQASAQSLREASRSSCREGAGHNNHSDSSNWVHSSAPLDIPRPQLQRQYSGPYAPPIPSPLGPKSSMSSTASDVQQDSDDSTSDPDGPPMRQGNSTMAATRETMPVDGQTHSRLLLRAAEIPQQESHSTLSQSTPRTVRDLGSDYTRYYNPFATRSNSANTSQQDLSVSAVSVMRVPTFGSSTNLAPTKTASSAKLSNRLSMYSNPFKDEHRKSASLTSLHDDVPDAPTSTKSKGNDQCAAPTTIPAAVAQAELPTFIRNADPEKAAFIPQYVDDRLGAPYILYLDEKEDDDDMHMPAWDDDRKYKPTIRERFSRENIVNTIGIIFLITGLCTIFVVLPVVSFTGTNLISYVYDTPMDQMPGHTKPEPWAHVNDNLYPLLTNIRTGLIDPDTPEYAMTRESVNGNTLKLVFSDEFNEKNRTFYEGDDPYWYAPDIWYGATKDLEWYDPDAVNTGDGTMQLQLDTFQNHDLGYRSGMLNSWNQLCFKGGVFEVSVSLPGPAGVHGLWPGVWTMGNLGRPGYLATTDGLWPYTYNDCDAGITPNQSMTDGTSFLPGQRLPSCTCRNEDHPSPGTGRGAPEIDIIEVSADWGNKGLGVATQSYQVAPFDVFYYPNYDFMEIPDYRFSYVNTYTGGPFQEAISTTTMLNNDWYDGKAYQKFAFEYEPGSGEAAHVTWTVGEDEMMRFDARAIGPNGNIQQRLIAEEPLSMILNLGFSHSWVAVDQANLRFPAVMRVDYVRWYQHEDGKNAGHHVTCDPPGYPTTDYIAKHPGAYQNPNVTTWTDAGYQWPNNTLMHSCST